MCRSHHRSHLPAHAPSHGFVMDVRLRYCLSAAGDHHPHTIRYRVPDKSSHDAGVSQRVTGRAQPRRCHHVLRLCLMRRDTIRSSCACPSACATLPCMLVGSGSTSTSTNNAGLLAMTLVTKSAKGPAPLPGVPALLPARLPALLPARLRVDRVERAGDGGCRALLGVRLRAGERGPHACARGPVVDTRGRRMPADDVFRFIAAAATGAGAVRHLTYPRRTQPLAPRTHG